MLQRKPQEARVCKSEFCGDENITREASWKCVARARTCHVWSLARTHCVKVEVSRFLLGAHRPLRIRLADADLDHCDA